MAEARVYRSAVERTPKTGTVTLDLTPTSDQVRLGTSARVYRMDASPTPPRVHTGSVSFDLNVQSDHIAISNVTVARMYRLSFSAAAAATPTHTGQATLYLALNAKGINPAAVARARVYRADTSAVLSTARARVYRSAVQNGVVTGVRARVYRFDGHTTVVTPGSQFARVYSVADVVQDSAPHAYYTMIAGLWIGTDPLYVIKAGQWVSQVDITVPTDPFVLGTTKPDESNTGVDPTIARTDFNGRTRSMLTITAANARYENLDFYCDVKVAAANVTFINCYFHGNGVFSATTDDCMIDCRPASCVNCTVTRCTLKPDLPTPLYTCIMGHDYTATRCCVLWGSDGLGVYRTQTLNVDTKVYLYGNYVDKLAFYTQAVAGFPVHPSDTKTHNDCLQIQGGNNTVVYGNNMQGFLDPTAPGVAPTPTDRLFNTANSAVQYNSNQGLTANSQLTYNWFDGGGASLNGAVKTANIGVIAHNRFGHRQNLQGSGYNDTFTVLVAGTATYTDLSNNTYEDNGVACHVRTNG